MRSDFDAPAVGGDSQADTTPIQCEPLEREALYSLWAQHMNGWIENHRLPDRLRRWRAARKHEYSVNHADAFPPIKLPPLDLTAAIPRVKQSA